MTCEPVIPLVGAPAPVLVNPLVSRPGSLHRLTMTRMFSKVPFRDTVSHDGKSMLQMLDNSNVFFDVVNTANQTVTVQLVTGLCGGYVGATPLGVNELIAANTSEGFTVAADSTWGPWVGIRIFFATAPTQGTVTVTLALREVQR